MSDIGVQCVADRFSLALAEAYARGDQLVAEILAGPDMLSADELGRCIGRSGSTVRRKWRRREVLGLPGAKRGIRYPKWQVTDSGQLLPGLPRIFEILGDHPWTVYRFLLMHHPELHGATALAALQEGRHDPVLATAHNVAIDAFS